MLIKHDLDDLIQFQITTQAEVNRLRKEYPKAVWAGMDRANKLVWPSVSFAPDSAAITAILLSYEVEEKHSSAAQQEALRQALEELCSRQGSAWFSPPSKRRGAVAKS